MPGELAGAEEVAGATKFRPPVLRFSVVKRSDIFIDKKHTVLDLCVNCFLWTRTLPLQNFGYPIDRHRRGNRAGQARTHSARRGTQAGRRGSGRNCSALSRLRMVSSSGSAIVTMERPTRCGPTTWLRQRAPLAGSREARHCPKRQRLLANLAQRAVPLSRALCWSAGTASSAGVRRPWSRLGRQSLQRH